MSYQERLTVQAVQWCDDVLKVLDQRQLPKVIAYDEYDNASGVAEAIKTMRIRGAPLIGIAAAYAVFLSARHRIKTSPNRWMDAVYEDIEMLSATRPTAVNLFWALDVMKKSLQGINKESLVTLLDVAKKIHQNDILNNLKMGQLGADILGNTSAVLTHCNAGALATGGYGTALGVIRSACEKGLKQVYATETRPWQQGSRLTAWELQQDGIAVTLIADSAAASLMKLGRVEWVITGADRITANGDVANKIGTYALAVLARQHGVKLMVVAPTSTIDWEMEEGDHIEIESRSSRELLGDLYPESSPLIQVWNPVFDVTPAELVSVIVTESGVVMNPSEEAMKDLRSRN